MNCADIQYNACKSFTVRAYNKLFVIVCSNVIVIIHVATDYMCIIINRPTITKMCNAGSHTKMWIWTLETVMPSCYYSSALEVSRLGLVWYHRFINTISILHDKIKAFQWLTIGCGKHVDQVMKDVPEDQRCTCPRGQAPSSQGSSSQEQPSKWLNDNQVWLPQPSGPWNSDVLL